MENRVLDSILKTLLYADIFSYPLTFFQIHTFLISNIPYKKQQLHISLKLLQEKGIIKKTGKRYIFNGKSELARMRQKNRVESRKKMEKAQKIIRVLSRIPTVQLIGISGSLSLNNARKHDDIDLFIITQKGALWMTRLWVNLTLLFMGEKRKRGEKFARDKICPNMYMSQGALEMIDNKKNLYSAHEIVQLKVMFQKNNAYNSFLFANKWVKKYLGNVKIPYVQDIKEEMGKKFLRIFFAPLEFVCYKVQYIYMRKRITNEIAMQSLAQFHPLNYDRFVLDLYKLRLKYLKKNIKIAFFNREVKQIPRHNLASFYDITPGS